MNELFSSQSAKFIGTLGFEIQSLKKRQYGGLMSTLSYNNGFEDKRN